MTKSDWDGSVRDFTSPCWSKKKTTLDVAVAALKFLSARLFLSIEEGGFFRLAPELIQNQNQEKKSRNLEFQMNPYRNKEIT